MQDSKRGSTPILNGDHLHVDTVKVYFDIVMFDSSVFGGYDFFRN